MTQMELNKKTLKVFTENTHCVIIVNTGMFFDWLSGGVEMRKTKRKMLTIITAFALAFTAVPIMTVPVYADAPSAINLVDEDGKVSGITGAQVSNVYFGKYKQSSDGAGGFKTEPIKWRVLSNDPDNGTLFMLSDKNLDCKRFHETWESITWENSNIRSWLNSTFINDAFSENTSRAEMVREATILSP